LEGFSKIPALIFKNKLLLENGLLIIEHSKHTVLSGLPNFSSERKYGGSVFSFFEAE
jgi:16S rRNA G966 N2-methylase RsmD